MTGRRVLPGFGLTLGYSLFALGLVVLLPLAMLALQASRIPWATAVAVASDPRVLASLSLTLGASLGAASISLLFGLVLAWVLVRYSFPGRRLVDSLIDLPFALPTAVAGIALTTLYASNGWIGALLDRGGLRVAYTRTGIVVALTFIAFPFIVRTVQPAIEDLDRELEEVAASLGATRRQTFLRVILPALLPSLLTGFTLALARAIGEYGSVIFIAGNMPMKTEIAPLLIMVRLEEYDYAGATVIAVMMLLASFALLLGANSLQRRLSAAPAAGRPSRRTADGGATARGRG